MKQNKELIQYLAISRQISICFLIIRTSSTYNGCLGRRMSLPFSIFLLVITAERSIKWCGLSLWSVGVSCPACSLLLAHPLLTLVRQRTVKQDTALRCVIKHVCYQPCLSH